MTIDELEDLNNEAWRRGVPFILSGEGYAMRTLEPSLFREQRLMNAINAAWMNVFLKPLPWREDD